jgi:sodium/hydrogen exchanger family protein
MKQNHSEAFKELWTDRRINRLPLTATILARVLIALSFIFYVCNYLTRFKNALMIALAVGLLILMLLSRWLKKRSITLERLFIQNLRSRDIEAQIQGKKKPLFADHLIDRDIHIANLELPDDSLWAGKTLYSLKLRNRFGVHISSILRGSQRINIPNGGTILFPGDKLQAIGDDEQLTKLSKAMKAELQPTITDIEKHEMKLRSFTISKTSPFIGKTLKDSGIRDKYNCMVVGVDEGQQNLTLITPSRCLQAGDVLWVVGEEKDLERILALG